MQAGSTTGAAGNSFTLGLKSGTACRAATSDQVKDRCDFIVDDSTGWKRNLTITGEFNLDICLPMSNSTSNWTAAAASVPWTPYAITEDLYIGLQELNESSWWICEQDDCLSTSQGLYVQCNMETLVSDTLQMHWACKHGLRPLPGQAKGVSSCSQLQLSTNIQNH